MTTHCYPITVLPHTSRLFADFLGSPQDGVYVNEPLLQRCYPALSGAASRFGWMSRPSSLTPEHRGRLADLLAAQNTQPAALANIERLRQGANAVVTGQQVVLFGGPLLTLLKAATAVARAEQATAAGHPHVPIFWLATEDHDLAEVNHVHMLSSTDVESLKAAIPHTAGQPVGGLRLRDGITQALDRATELLAHAPVSEALREAYAPGATLAGAFARFIAGVFAAHGLIVLDAASREFHSLAAPTLEYAIRNAAALQSELRKRSTELEKAGYHAQVLVAENASTLFLIDETTGVRNALRLAADSPDTPDAPPWKAGTSAYCTKQLLEILRTAPERLSPNVLLRPVFQDTLLPTSLYIGGPAEIAYFAQSQVLYQAILGRTTTVDARLSATLIEPAIATVMAKHEVELPQAFTSPDELAQRLGARAMPVEGKQKLSAAGNALNQELEALTAWMHSLSSTLGASADVSASKMRYQMNRLRRMAATFELQRTASIARHAAAISLYVFPLQHPQERIVAGAWFLARFGDDLPATLIEAAKSPCRSHQAIEL
ncbi:MAG TPA: bacillithiol biosynthesis cysteine-adding enzyme BshC [Acidobacteriaceae bacterium]